ncbi:hypothetical protein [Deinococcus hopiensis]|uniref:Uncharacterized protein n=1 Tax=Deinococcus hopiensis KR-140 TaxID=695939 RepID=A0A1W1UXE6_9DEIO|nr:hypothetical protein [Deinococcus hopiensis]SMB85414.1 hypothetical protein SAMN00790413_03392 [Deinococcus hopiensis KR-140]
MTTDSRSPSGRKRPPGVLPRVLLEEGSVLVSFRQDAAERQRLDAIVALGGGTLTDHVRRAIDGYLERDVYSPDPRTYLADRHQKLEGLVKTAFRQEKTQREQFVAMVERVGGHQSLHFRWALYEYLEPQAARIDAYLEAQEQQGAHAS